MISKKQVKTYCNKTTTKVALNVKGCKPIIHLERLSIFAALTWLTFGLRISWGSARLAVGLALTGSGRAKSYSDSVKRDNSDRNLRTPRLSSNGHVGYQAMDMKVIKQRTSRLSSNGHEGYQANASWQKSAVGGWGGGGGLLD